MTSPLDARCADLAAALAAARIAKNVSGEHLAIAKLIAAGRDVLAERAAVAVAAKEGKP